MIVQAKKKRIYFFSSLLVMALLLFGWVHLAQGRDEYRDKNSYHAAINIGDVDPRIRHSTRETTNVTINQLELGDTFNVASQASQVNDLWVDSVSGDDTNNGLTPSTAFRTIQKAADVVAPGDTILIRGGTYHEEITLSNSGNSNNWITFRLTGSISNKSAVGSKVRLKASIDGNDVWQFREVLGQNNFNGQNSLRVHFGLGNASVIDSVIIDYPSGQRKILTNLVVNNFYTDEEEIPSGYLKANFRADSITGEEQLTVQFDDWSVADPFNPITSWEWDFNNDGTIDATDENPSFTYSGIGEYSVKLVVSTGSAIDTILRENYISVTPITGVENETSQIPTEFNLYQNYPNPFNPTTTINYSVPKENFISLKVYNMLGAEVATLVNEKKTPGLYELNFGGENLPSGVYVYRIEAGSFSASKKMLLIK